MKLILSISNVNKKKRKLLIVLIIVVCVRDAGHAGLCTLVNENRNVIQSRDGVRRAERERERQRWKETCGLWEITHPWGSLCMPNTTFIGVIYLP